MPRAALSAVTWGRRPGYRLLGVGAWDVETAAAGERRPFCGGGEEGIRVSMHHPSADLATTYSPAS
jgi:hypothetical protein